MRDSGVTFQEGHFGSLGVLNGKDVVEKRQIGSELGKELLRSFH
jgi:hypothetical protein